MGEASGNILNEKLNALLENIHEFIAGADPERLPALETITRNARRQSFRVCVAGGFSRGKSHFLNQLLRCRLLPESAVPTTACLTEIVYGAQPEMLVIRKSGEEKLPLTEEALLEFSQMPDRPLPEAELRIFYPSPLLADGLVLLDTPGVEDTISQGAELTHGALENADAAIIMISAITPFSLTERAFIKTYMQDRSIPLLAACVSFLDQVAPEAVEKQLEFIRAKRDALYPEMALLCADCRGQNEKGMICGLENIRRCLRDWEHLPELARLRRKMVLGRLAMLLKSCVLGFSYKKELLLGDVRQKRHELDNAISGLDDRQDVCSELKIWFLERKNSLEDKIGKMSRAWSNTLIHEIERGNLQTPHGPQDPEEIILASFDKFYQETCEYARANLEESVAGLSRKMAEMYGAPLVMAPWEDFPPSIPISLTRQERDSVPMKQLVDEIFRQGELVLDRFVSRMPAVNLIWGNLRPFAHELLQKARQFIIGGESGRQVFERQVSTICSRMNLSFQEEIDRVYQQVFEAVRQNRLAWLRAREKELEKCANLDEKTVMLGQISSALIRGEELLTEIHAQQEQI